jgi:hypothetical protein
MLLNDCHDRLTQAQGDATIKLFPKGEVYHQDEFASALGNERMAGKFLRDAAKRKLIALAGKVWRRL